MNQEALTELITQVAPALAAVIAKKPPPRDVVSMTGARLIAFLQHCPADVQPMQFAIDEQQEYCFSLDILRELANPRRQPLERAEKVEFAS